ncbi:hypothetical protein ACJZL1_06485 [Wolbachia endosymbiont of Rhagoletis indifferens]
MTVRGGMTITSSFCYVLAPRRYDGSRRYSNSSFRYLLAGSAVAT